MTNQEIFTRVWTHFVTEKNPKSVTEKGICAYRGPNGAMCAIGILLQDDVYDPILEDNNWRSLQYLDESAGAKGKAVAKIRNALGYLDNSFLQEMQNAHDGSTSVKSNSIEARLRLTASRYNLTIPE